MGELSVEPPEEFTELVRDALLHLYDLAHLQIHSLVALAGAADCRLLRQTLLDAIRTLHPGPGVAAASRAWRCYRILELRYVVGLEVEDVIERVALSKRQYHREHHRALQAISSLLWQRWRLSSRWTAPTQSRTRQEGDHRNLARTEAERLALGEAVSRVDPADVLQGIEALLRPLCVQRGVELELALTGYLPTIRGDRVALRQALLSILTHVIGAASPGTLKLAATCQAQEVVVELSGPGTTDTRCWQLGIEESRPFVEALHGSLSYLPPSTRSDRWTVHLSFPAMDSPTLLVVDNNESFVSLVKRYLAGHDWEVIGTPDVGQAYALARQRRPQAILLDVIIPGRDGWDLLTELKTTPTTQDIPVVICSVLRESEMAISLGATAYLQKPISQRQLVEALEALKGAD